MPSSRRKPPNKPAGWATMTKCWSPFEKAATFQTDDYRNNFLTGLKDPLRGDATKIIAETNYELTSSTNDTQMIQLKTSGADTLFNFSTPKFQAQALKKLQELV